MPQEPPKVLSPMDTYEISERDSDSESEEYSDSEDEKSPKKKTKMGTEFQSYSCY